MTKTTEQLLKEFNNKMSELNYKVKLGLYNKNNPDAFKETKNIADILGVKL